MLRFVKSKLKHHQLMLNTFFVVSITSVMFVYPFNNHFRFTFGVVALAVAILYFRQLPIVKTALLSSLGIFLTRLLLDVVIHGNNISQAISQTFPASVYYLSFGLCLCYFNIRATMDNPYTTIWKLSFGDMLSNVLELLLRNYFFDGPVHMMPEIAAAAMVRSVMTIYGYYLLRRYQAFIVEEEHAKRYSELILVFAELKTELYYLKKSSQDIEGVMTRAMRLYREAAAREKNVATQTLQLGLLTIAKDIHEIKNDYYRVIGGMENIINISNHEQTMNIGEIFSIIEQNTLRFLNVNQKQIQVVFVCNDVLITNKHYTIVSILNNLIINAIEACSNGGHIRVTQQLQDGQMILSVEDNGCGIAVDDYEMIFTPGYSTKYSSLSGQMSTGLGLTHIKTLLEIIGGTITVTSVVGSYTKFTIVVAAANLEAEPAAAHLPAS